jgi:2-phosphosulfolactate phosphatase
MEIDVALVPSEARGWDRTVCIVIDELRASSTITTLLDLGCDRVYLTVGLRAARALAREHHGLLAGERHGYAPPGFDFDNSPAAISRGDVRGRVVVLSTTNGTRVLSHLTAMPATLVGCLLNARACAEAAARLADSLDARVGIICAGTKDRFAIEDGVTAGVFIERLIEAVRARGGSHSLTEGAVAAVRLRESYPDLLTLLRESVSGELVTMLGAGDDVPFCARLDVSTTVPVLRPGVPLSVERLAAHDA